MESFTAALAGKLETESRTEGNEEQYTSATKNKLFKPTGSYNKIKLLIIPFIRFHDQETSKVFKTFGVARNKKGRLFLETPLLENRMLLI
ncbi:MAG TPA: hypothetical protein VFF27_16090 [Bacteroidia bacterium]|nr:hypothetical protein [Bacteroidia bacterium]